MKSLGSYFDVSALEGLKPESLNLKGLGFGFIGFRAFGLTLNLNAQSLNAIRANSLNPTPP